MRQWASYFATPRVEFQVSDRYLVWPTRRESNDSEEWADRLIVTTCFAAIGIPLFLGFWWGLAVLPVLAGALVLLVHLKQKRRKLQRAAMASTPRMPAIGEHGRVQTVSK
jgi:hypothetical protein